MGTTSSSQGTSSSTTLDRKAPQAKVLKVEVKCGECGTLTEPAYHGGDGVWKCTKHEPKQRPCRDSIRGCTYSDIDGKCSKHEVYCCQYSTQCTICLRNITGTALDSHYTQAHGDLTHRAGTVCTVSPAVWNWLIIDCDLGRVVCVYRLYNLDFLLSVYTPLPRAQLYKYRCTVELSHPDTGHTLTRVPAVQYDYQEDWRVDIPHTDYNTYVHDGEVNIKINITEIDDPQQFGI